MKKQNLVSRFKTDGFESPLESIQLPDVFTMIETSLYDDAAFIPLYFELLFSAPSATQSELQMPATGNATLERGANTKGAHDAPDRQIKAGNKGYTEKAKQSHR